MAEIIETYAVDDYEILTDTGWEDLVAVHKTVSYVVWSIQTECFNLRCADTHTVFDENFNEVFVKDLVVGSKIVTKNGPELITHISQQEVEENMFDLTVNSSNHRMFTNGILSHNSTLLTIYVLWLACFTSDQRAIIVANKEKTAINIFKRVRLAYELLPNFLKPGVKDYAKTEMNLANDSSIAVSTTTATSIRGESASVLCVTGDMRVKMYDHITNRRGAHRIEDIAKLTKKQQKRYHINSEYRYVPFDRVAQTGFADYLIEIKTIRGHSIKVTPEHIIPTKNRKWQRAMHLQVGDILQSDYGRVTITDINHIHLEKPVPVYDVFDTGDHQFYCNNLLIHNCIDEAAHIDSNIIEEFWGAVIPAISAGKKSKILMVSTPNGTGNKFYDIYSGAEKGTNGWKAERIDWQDVPGRGERWRKDMLAALGGSEQRFLQEFGNYFLDSSDTAVGLVTIEQFKREKKKIIWSSEDKKYNVWEPPTYGKLYVVGVDVGEGIGKAASVAHVLDISDLTDIRQVAVFASNDIEPYHYANRLHNLLNSWGRPPVLIERNNCGAQIIDALYYKHFYDRLVSYTARNASGNNIGSSRTASIGIYSNNNIRFSTVQNLRYWLNALNAVRINDPTTISELETFVRHPNGVYRKKADTFFDDRVLALCWSLFILEPAICSQYFTIEDYDTQGKPAQIVPNDTYESSKDYYQLRDLASNLPLNIIGTLYSIQEENEKTEIRKAMEAHSELLAQRQKEEDEWDFDDLLERGYIPLQ